MLIVLEWFVWALSCAIAVWALIAFLVEIFMPDPFPSGPEAIYPIPLRRIITALYFLGITTAIITTAVWDVSKLHLLWFVPLFHFFGTEWVSWIFLKWPYKFPLVVSILVGVLVGSLPVGYVVTKYAKVQASMNQLREAIQQYIYANARSMASDFKDAESENLERQARERAEKCERELKGLEGFWIKYENGNWYIRSKWFFFTICVLLGLGVTGLIVPFVYWILNSFHLDTK
jgi:uncharacterized integral membrane protein